MRIDELAYKKNYRNNLEIKGTVIKEEATNKSKSKAKDGKNASKYRRRLSGKTLSQIDQEYHDYILELLNTASEYTIAERNEIVSDVAEYYYLQTGYTMPNVMLGGLADFILDDTLADTDPWKVRHDEYSVLSFRQLKKRNNIEVSVDGEHLDYFSAVDRYGKSGKRNTQEKGENK